MKRHSIWIWIGVLGMWIMGGTSYPLMSDVTKVVSPINLVFYRSFGSAILLGLITVMVAPRSFREIRWNKRLIPLVIASLLFNPGCAATLAWSSSKIPGAISALLFASLPAMATLFGALVGRRTTRMAVAGVAIASIAVAFLVGQPTSSISTSGMLAALGATLSWFVATEVWVTYNPQYPLLLATFMQVLIGAVGCLLVRPVVHAPAFDYHLLLIGGVIILTFTFATQHLMYLGISNRVSGPILTSFGLVNPLVAALVGYFYFAQKISHLQIVAGLILSIGVMLVVHEERRIISVKD